MAFYCVMNRKEECDGCGACLLNAAYADGGD